MRHLQWSLTCMIGVMCFALPAWSMPSAGTDAACITPAPGAGWQSASAAASGFDPARLCSVLQQVAQGEDNVHGVLIERGGKLVAELYRRGSDRPLGASPLGGLFPRSVEFAADTLHDMRSVSKSVIGLLVGVSVERGSLRLDETVLDRYPELSALRSEGRERIQLRHLLDMSAGLEWHEMGHGFFTSSETPLVWQSDPARYYFDRALASPPGAHFNYAGGATAVLADLLVTANGKPLEQLLQEDLFGPMGIETWEWAANLRGVPMAYAGLRLKPRDMLKLGRLLHNGGAWNGRQVVPRRWVEATMQTRMPVSFGLLGLGGEVGYGHQWWNGTVNWRGRTLRWTAAVGNGGQRIVAVPALDITLAVVAGDYGSPAIQEKIGRLVMALLETVAAQ